MMNNVRKTMKSTSDIRMYSIDGLKGILACIVAFVWHYQHFLPIGSPFYCVLKPFYEHGYLAVEFFYMISGFGMVLGYESRIISGEIDTFHYVNGRVKRLFMPVLLSTMVTTVLQLIYMHSFGNIMQYASEFFTVDHFVLNILGLQTGIIGREYSFNGPLWFVSVLIVCYVIFYLVVRYNVDKEDIIPLLYWIIMLIGLAIIHSGLSKPLLNEEMGRGLASFFAGAILSSIYRKTGSKNASKASWGMICLLGFVVIISAIYGYGIIGNIRLYVIIWFGPSVIWIVINNRYIKWIFELLEPLGKHSMSIFVWHFPIQILLMIISRLGIVQIDFSSRIAWCSYVIITIIIACVYDMVSKKLTAINIDRL